MHRQRGSALTVIVIAILIAIGYWQRERIARLAPGMGAKNATPVLEVTSFECTPPGPASEARGAVRNNSLGPLSLRAIVLWKISGLKAIWNYPQVAPAMLAPGASGSFELQVALPPGGGECRLGGFLNAENTHMYFDSRGETVLTF
jgi:hypothetical protein